MIFITSAATDGPKQRASLVLFIGGCTYAEISAVRLLARQEGI